MVPGRDLVIALILGVLLPAIISRPALIERHPMRPHTRARWTFMYSVFAFAAAAFVYISANELLDGATRHSSAERGTLNGAGLLIFLLLCVHHVPPLLSADKSAPVRLGQVTLAMVLGLLMGGFFAADTLAKALGRHTADHVRDVDDSRPGRLRDKLLVQRLVTGRAARDLPRSGTTSAASTRSSPAAKHANPLRHDRRREA